MSNTKVVYMKIKLKGFILVAFILSCTFLSGQAGGAGNVGLSRGESLFKENNAKDAVQVLEYEILNGQISDNSYNFLGLGYYQLGEYEKSLDAFRRGIKAQPENVKILSYNMGNTFYAIKDYNSAINCYSDALKADPLFYDALLNRANALLMSGQLVSAKEEYVDFLTKCPDNAQHERIELLIKALAEEITRREEEARLLAEQNKAQWEEYENEGSAVVVEEEAVTDEENWLTFSDDELNEMDELAKQSREEHEKWLENERRRAQEIATREAQARQREQQSALEEERKLREQMLEDMRKSEEERRKKLLEDVANSLQGSDSTNLTSGAEDLIDYDLEGELD